MNKAVAILALIGLALVGGAACDLANDAKAAIASTKRGAYNDGDERNAYAFGTPSPERKMIVQQTTREQRMRYCREMFGMDGQNPLAPDYRPAPGDLCYSVWKELYLDPELAHYAHYYKNRL